MLDAVVSIITASTILGYVFTLSCIVAFGVNFVSKYFKVLPPDIPAIASA